MQVMTAECVYMQGWSNAHTALKKQALPWIDARAYELQNSGVSATAADEELRAAACLVKLHCAIHRSATRSARFARQSTYSSRRTRRIGPRA